MQRIPFIPIVLLLLSKERAKLEERIETLEILENYATPQWRRENLSFNTFSLPGSISLKFVFVSFQISS